MGAARASTVVDDDRVRVTTTLTFDEIGDATGWHVREHDYVIVPVTSGTFEVTDPDGGKHELSQEAGVPYLGQAGTEHDVANVGAAAAVFVEIELKR